MKVAIKVLLVSTCFIILSTLPSAGALRGVPMAPWTSSKMLDVDHRKLVSRADIIYNKLAPRPEEGLPLGNGRMGGLLWNVGSGFQMQVNRPDVFGDNSYTSLPGNGELGYACGRVFIDVGEKAFPAEGTRQHLSLYDAAATITSPELTVQALACANSDVMVFRIDDQREKPAPVSLRLQMLREPVIRRRGNKAVSKISEYREKISLTQVYKELAVNGIAEGDHYCSSALVAGIGGRKGTVRVVDERTIELTAPAAKGSFTIFIASASTFKPSDDVTLAASENIDKAVKKGFKALAGENKTWWHSFWSKSFVDLHSNDGSAEFLEKYRTGWLYHMACCSRGNYPPEWGCQLWYSRGDRYGWSGGHYWWWNLQCNYRGLAAANHLELACPVYNMYSGAYDNAAHHAKQVRGCEGIFLSETMTWNGPEKLTESIGSELKDFLSAKKTFAETSPEFKAYAQDRNTNESSWCWIEYIKGDEVSPYSWHVHTFSSGAKIAWQFYRAYEYTLDKDWLQRRAYPMIKGMAEFYRTYPDVKKAEDGKYHIYHVNSHEPLWGGNDTHEELCAMRAMFSLAIHCSEILGVDEALRPKWKDMLENLAPLPTSDTPGAIGVPKHPSGKPTWANAVGPAAKGAEDVDNPTFTRPCVDYDLWTLETADPEVADTAVRTMECLCRYKDLKDGRATFCLSDIPAAVVMMGRADEVKQFLPLQLSQKGWRDNMELLPNFLYFQDFDPAHAYPSTEGVGFSADNLQNALLQSVPPGPGQDPVIHVFPAWPRDWDASFQLAARRGFLVTASMQKGKIDFVEISAGLGGTCRIRNPWPGQIVDLYRNGKKTEQLSGDLLIFQTAKNENIVLTEKDSPVAKSGRIPM